MIFENKITFTSEPINNTSGRITEKYLLITGAGTVYIDQLSASGMWITPPELIFTGSQAAIISIKAGMWRVRIADGPVTVEIV